jgi:hypothetical protein
MHMCLKLAKTAAAGVAATVAIGTAQPALAAPALTASVPCSPVALAAAITGAASNETLRLAVSCRYVLTAALPAINANLTIRGNGATLQRSTAAGIPRFAILTVASGNLAVSQLSFRNANGGAISYESTSAAGHNIAVTGGIFAGNAGGAINDDGAINEDGSPGGALTVTGATFTGNTGGAINDGDESSGAGALTVAGATFTHNTGGAITDFGNSLAGQDTVIRSIFTGNAGGGINYQSYWFEGPSTLQVTSSSFAGNTGSGINCTIDEICSLSVTGSAFTGNSGSGINAGGGATQGEDFLTVSRSTFTRNRGTRGGGIDLDSFAAGSLTATRDTFTGNTATVGGGAIYNFDFAAVTSSTFSGNSAPVGGGMENEWEADLGGSTFRQNTAGSGGGLYNDDHIAVTGTTFGGNTAGSGGGVYQIPAGADNNGQDVPTLSLTGSNISANKATVDGGGIGNTIDVGYTGTGPGPGTVTVTRSPVLGNSAGQHGGGIYNFGGGSVPLISSVVRGNRPDNCAPANAVPGCGNSAAALAQVSDAGRRVSPAPGLRCAVDRLGERGRMLDQRPGLCGVHYLAARVTARP